MADVSDPICFHCGQVFVADGRFNHLPDGRPCPLCSDRLMDSLPPLIPSWNQVEPETEDARDEAFAPTHLRPVQDRPEPA